MRSTNAKKAAIARKSQGIKTALLVFIFASFFVSSAFAHLLRVQPEQSSGNNPCSSGNLDYGFRIYNDDTVGVNLNTITLNFWVYVSGVGGDTGVPQSQGWWGGNVYNAGGTNLAYEPDGTVTISSIAYCSDVGGQANYLISLALTDNYVIPPGGYYAGGHGTISRGSWLNPMDFSCDDYSKPGATTYHDDTHWVAVESGFGEVWGAHPCSIPTATATPTIVGILNCAKDSSNAWSCKFIPVILSTPTFTPTYTRTPTRTATPTFTSTFTFTSTKTATSTYTSTPSPTPTFTATSTRTATPTPSNTPSPTPTFTSTSTKTATSTYTNTQSPSNTPSPTPTFTATSTKTATSTYTDTMTATSTRTATDTISSNTPTATPTFTDTFTPTATFTATGTFTCTFTTTSTRTATSTFTNTTSATFTSTATSTYTATPTVTETSIYTATATPTYTLTKTDTPTFTASPTYTSTRTETNTATPTMTRTDTPTYTATGTETSTRTATPTASETRTVTSTPTITVTSIPYPYIITIGVYNEAGELVKVISTQPANAMLTGVELDVPGNTGTAIIVGNDNKLYIYVAGVETPLTLGQGGTQFTWDVTNNQSQYVDPGSYYIKVEETDEYGHVNVVVKDAEVVRVEQYVELKVFNGAGELVRSIRDSSKSLPAMADLSGVPDILTFEKTGAPLDIKYGAGASDFIQWDGRAEDGRVVSSGNYELQLTVKNPSGTVTTAEKTVIVLREDKKYLADFKVSPSPFSDKSGTDHVTFAWTCLTAGETGDANIRVYNVAGELVKEIKTTLQAASATWDLKAGMDGHVSRGFYVVVITTKNSQGYAGIKTTKLAVLGYK